MPEVKLGYIPDSSSSYYLPRIFKGSKEMGMYLGVMGNSIKGVDVAKLGIATHYADSKSLAKMKELIISNAEDLKSED